CDKALRHVVDQVAFLSLRSCEWARAYYDQQRARGHSHRQALRALGAKWLKIIFVMWQRRASHDDQYHLPSLARQQLRQRQKQTACHGSDEVSGARGSMPSSSSSASGWPNAPSPVCSPRGAARPPSPGERSSPITSETSSALASSRCLRPACASSSSWSCSPTTAAASFTSTSRSIPPPPGPPSRSSTPSRTPPPRPISCAIATPSTASGFGSA